VFTVIFASGGWFRARRRDGDRCVRCNSNAGRTIRGGGTDYDHHADVLKTGSDVGGPQTLFLVDVRSVSLCRADDISLILESSPTRGRSAFQAIAPAACSRPADAATTPTVAKRRLGLDVLNLPDYPAMAYFDGRIDRHVGRDLRVR